MLPITLHEARAHLHARQAAAVADLELALALLRIAAACPAGSERAILELLGVSPEAVRVAVETAWAIELIGYRGEPT